ncbi:hypothetical protein CPC08DRAFT_731133 [Agrocybe pediades]|nr:hypothetical protein CPC08DRAFT_731133 [Agrocybe pediades]
MPLSINLDITRRCASAANGEGCEVVLTEHEILRRSGCSRDPMLGEKQPSESSDQETNQIGKKSIFAIDIIDDRADQPRHPRLSFKFAEQRKKELEMVYKPIERAVWDSRRHQVTLTRDYWLKEAENDAEAVEATERVGRARGVIESHFGVCLGGVSGQEEFVEEVGSVEEGAWAKLFPLFSLERAFAHCPQVAVLWLSDWPLTKWSAGDAPAARSVFVRTFMVNAESERSFSSGSSPPSSNADKRNLDSTPNYILPSNGFANSPSTTPLSFFNVHSQLGSKPPNQPLLSRNRWTNTLLAVYIGGTASRKTFGQL